MYAKVFNNQDIETFRRWVEEAHHIVLLSHMNADGDACGSILGMTIQLDSAALAAESITPILPNGCPRNFTWLPASERILSGDTQLDLCRQKIAEADLKLRGPGDIQGLQQSGVLDLKIADIVDDEPLVTAARDVVNRILEGDPTLEQPEHYMLNLYIRNKRKGPSWDRIS